MSGRGGKPLPPVAAPFEGPIEILYRASERSAQDIVHLLCKLARWAAVCIQAGLEQAGHVVHVSIQLRASADRSHERETAVACQPLAVVSAKECEICTQSIRSSSPWRAGGAVLCRVHQPSPFCPGRFSGDRSAKPHDGRTNRFSKRFGARS